ncbi:hypothetical protein PXD04_08180 [Methanosphaera sp. ISO3-F5]|uniref:hypothetical protein n=1 Tax=Methanosphaera sp. ISO3-F5 TaxID=1452353 RepID=UPI002B25CFAC|nr:hypothetical protein [Methanosphaera sp. ISO3-F5]WQH63670.1 hypothetical protein PXD04_08180 [Methanosphaera sp. ISO3-F5]
MAEEDAVLVCACCCIMLIIFVIFGGGGSSDHENSTSDIKVKSNSSSSGYSSTKNPSTSTSSSQSSNTGYQTIIIENMVREDYPNLVNHAGFGYIGTLIPKGKNFIIKLDESDWQEIMRQTNRNPIGKSIYVDIQHDDFEESWDGDDFYYIEEFY